MTLPRQEEPQLSLGNVLHRLAVLDPAKLRALEVLAREALAIAEKNYKQRFRRDPYKETMHPDWKR